MSYSERYGAGLLYIYIDIETDAVIDIDIDIDINTVIDCADDLPVGGGFRGECNISKPLDDRERGQRGSGKET